MNQLSGGDSPIKKFFFGMTFGEIEAECGQLGVSAMHARDLFRSAYKEGSLTPWTRSGIPKSYASHCEQFYAEPRLRMATEHRSQYDGSVKFVIELEDQRQIEMVLMPESKRVTLCISSQVGCAQGCIFCHTGRMGLVRNLDASEIVGQVWMASQWIDQHPEWLMANRLPSRQRITNIVFMGMGEPLDNVDAVNKSISILTNPFGMNLAKRRISVSTAGHLEGLDSLLTAHPDARLAVSIHSAFDSERSKIMPINRKWPLESLIQKIRSSEALQKNGVLLQYTLISGVNDSIDHARKLIELVQGMNVKINIIPLNPVGPSRLTGPKAELLAEFRDEIFRSGLRVMVRYSKGQDIAAACGQLVVQPKNQ